MYKIEENSEIVNQFFTPGELARASWFPIKSENTIRCLVRKGILKAVNTSSLEDKVRFAIPKKEVIKYLMKLKIN
jgi:hypothetical protein